MAKHVQFNLTEKEFDILYLLMKETRVLGLMDGYEVFGWDVEDWKAFNRALERANYIAGMKDDDH